MRMRAKKPVRTKKSAYAKYAARIGRSSRTIGTRTMFITVLGFLGVAVISGVAMSTIGDDRATVHAAAKPASPTAPAAAAPAAADEPIPPVGIPAAAVAASTTHTAPVTTITGCLAREDAAYKLKDASGDAAPKARSWKTGFLKKGAAPIELYDSGNRAKLPTHVGQRVSVTGDLVDREMYVRSVQRVSASCATKS